MKYASVVWSFDSTSSTPYQLDAYGKVGDKIVVDVSKEYKTFEGLKKGLQDTVKKIGEEVKL